MKDTRETLTRNLLIPRSPANNELGENIAPENRPAPRFKIGDKLVSAYFPDHVMSLNDDPYWDYEFGGWLVAPGAIGVHESNFVLADEVDEWEPHAEETLWSYWTKKEAG
jgi:hypothetical protein